jgi:hypothetical protein
MDIDLRNTREVSGVHSEFRVEIRDALHAGRPTGRQSNSAGQCCRATIGRGCWQFSETFEVKPVAEPPREPLPPTPPWRAAVGSAAAAFAGCSDPRIKPRASSNRCGPSRPFRNYGPSGPNAIARSCGMWPMGFLIRRTSRAVRRTLYVDSSRFSCGPPQGARRTVVSSSKPLAQSSSFSIPGAWKPGSYDLWTLHDAQQLAPVYWVPWSWVARGLALVNATIHEDRPFRGRACRQGEHGCARATPSGGDSCDPIHRARPTPQPRSSSGCRQQ